MKSKYLSLISILAFLPAVSWAATHTAGSCSLADVTAAYSAASTGDTVVIPEDNCTWSSGLTLSKSITLKGAGAGSTIITNNGANPLIHIKLPSDVPVRITGISFDQVTNNNRDKYSILVGERTDGSHGLTHVRIDHNRFNKGKRTVYVVGWAYGVIDNNTFVNCDIAVGITGDDNHAWSRPIEAGTGNALFIENNTFVIDDNSDYEANEQIYHQEGGRTVIRHNTFDGSTYTEGNSLFFDSHGNQNYHTGTNNDFRGQPMIELYNNTMNAYKTYRFVYIRGGSSMIHNNIMTLESGSAAAIVLSEEESWQSAFFDRLASTWPAQDQIMNSFFWNNTLNGNAVSDVVLNNESDTLLIRKNRDYFMHAPEASGGRAVYTDRPGGAQSFVNSGPNAYYPYTPYVHPHPLTQGVIPPGNIRITQ